MTIRAITDPHHLRAWIRARGQKYIVWRVADLLSMHPERQQDWCDLHRIVIGESLMGADIRRQIQHCGNVWGYVLWPITRLESLTIDDFRNLQDLVMHYEGVRLHKGEPSHSEPCGTCSPPHSKDCPECAGRGVIWVLLELSPDEQTLAETGALPQENQT